MTNQTTIILENLTIEQLKSLAYDELVRIELSNENLKQINQFITRKTNEATKPENQPSAQMADKKPGKVEAISEKVLPEKPKKDNSKANNS